MSAAVCRNRLRTAAGGLNDGLFAVRGKRDEVLAHEKRTCDVFAGNGRAFGIAGGNDRFFCYGHGAVRQRNSVVDGRKRGACRAVFVPRAGICRRVFADDAFRRVENTACRGVADGAEYRFCGGYRAASRFRFHRAGIRHIFNEFCGVFAFLQAPERNNRRIFPPRFQGQKARDDRGRRRNRVSDRQGTVYFEARFFPPRMYSGRR